MLWWWCVDHAEDGDLRSFKDVHLAAAVDLASSEAKTFLDALVGAGFVERDPYLRLANWWRYSKRFMQQRYKDSPEKWRRIELLYAVGKVTDTVTDTVTVTATQETNQPTVPTEQNQQNQTNQNQNHTCAPKRVARVSDEQEKLFDRFWDAYPRHVNKKRARELFLKLNPSVVDAIFQALEIQKKSDAWTKDGGQFIPHPTTWINGKRWEDEPFVGGPGVSRPSVPSRNPGVTGFRSAHEILEGLGASV
jgi:hypothetical protein